MKLQEAPQRGGGQQEAEWNLRVRSPRVAVRSACAQIPLSRALFGFSETNPVLAALSIRIIVSRGT